jgi:endogenous inhibitor of DNA gyrase (YacG/DUF329 family)
LSTASVILQPEGWTPTVFLMPFLRCPVCHRRFESDESDAMPFCSNRCRQIDLGRWLDEGYSVPVQRDREEVAEGWEGDEEA